MFRKTILALVLPLSFAASAQAENAASPFSFVVGAGLTYGGDKLATISYTDNTEADIRAGSGLDMKAGIDYRFNQTFSAQATIGYHIHFTPQASNGDADFSRMPLELIAYVHPNPQWRIGAGVRHVLNPKVSGSGAAANITTKFKNTTGAVFEAEYFYSQKVGIKLRFVKEEYKTEYGNFKFSGDHLGLFANYYF